MHFPMSSDYIKYLNDPDCHGLNYDQWKDRKNRKPQQNNIKSTNRKKPFNTF